LRKNLIFNSFPTTNRNIFNKNQNSGQVKIILVNTSDTIGGAAVACRRLLDALFQSGTDVKMLVEEKLGKDEKVISINNNFLSKKFHFFRFALEYLYFLKFERAKGNELHFSPALFGTDISKHPIIQQADIINLHWTNNSFISINNLGSLMKLKKPIVWHLHDLWAFTGGCHHPGNCPNFEISCGNCPILKNSGSTDLSARIWKRKSEIYANADITIVTPSEWLANIARRSSLFKNITIQNIPNPIDKNIFMPIEKNKAKQQLGLDVQKNYILFGAVNTGNKRKGFDYFKEALKIFQQNYSSPNEIELLALGKVDNNLFSQLPYKINSFGTVNNTDKIIQIYNAASVFVTPSLEENLPNMIMEAMSCGTATIGFNTGGIPEMIEHKKNGFVAEYKSAKSLSEGINWVLNFLEPMLLSALTREKVLNNYSNEIVAKKYNLLFKELLEKRN